MTHSVQFETPENVHVQYTLAGLGTRFLAWFIDQILVTVFMFALLVLLACAGTSFSVVTDWLKDFDPDSMPPEELGMYMIGFMTLLMGLGSFFYYTVCELFWQGQTPGKRVTHIRVVKVDGFALDAGSILIRNIFRVLDHIPVTWIIPAMSKRSQRSGDMVAGTVVISDETPEMSEIREQLSERKAVEAEFRFDAKSLDRLNEQDFDAVERLLDRWHDVPDAQRRKLANKLVTSLVAKMKVAAPPEESQVVFLEDLLAAQLRRHNRLLG